MTRDMLTALMDSFKDPVLFVDWQHTVCFMNEPARLHYNEGLNLIGTNVLDCHAAISQRMILELWGKMQRGELVEALITDNQKYRIYMRAVFNGRGKVIGYFERYEPPVLTIPAN